MEKLEFSVEKVEKFTGDFPVQVHMRGGKLVKAHERGVKGKLMKEILLLKVEKLKAKKKAEEMILTEEDYAIVRFGASGHYPTYEEYLEREIQRIENIFGLDFTLVGSLTEDYPVKSYSRGGKKVKAHTREEGKKGEQKELKKEIKEAIKLRKRILKHLNRVMKGKGVILKSDKKELLKHEEVLYRKINRLQTELILSKKNDFTTDFIDSSQFKKITTDTYSNDFTVYHGSLTREGPFEYEKDGKMITVYKDYDNLSEKFAEEDYFPLKAISGIGSHYTTVKGFTTNFEYEDKPQEGNKYRHVYGDVIVLNDTFGSPEEIDLRDFHVSIGFKDHFIGDQQIIDYIDHLAMSDYELGRCITGGATEGDACIVKKKELKHDFREDSEERWITMRGTHVLVKKGQSPKEALEALLTKAKRDEWKNVEWKKAQHEKDKPMIKELDRREKYRFKKDKLKRELAKTKPDSKEWKGLVDKIEAHRWKEQQRRRIKAESDKQERDLSKYQRGKD